MTLIILLKYSMTYGKKLCDNFIYPASARQNTKWLRLLQMIIRGGCETLCYGCPYTPQ